MEHLSFYTLSIVLYFLLNVCTLPIYANKSYANYADENDLYPFNKHHRRMKNKIFENLVYWFKL